MPLLRTLLLNGTLGLGAYWTARHGFRMPRGLPRGLAAFTTAWAWAILGMEVLGPLGCLTYGPLLGWSAAALAVGLSLRLRDVHSRGAAVEESGPASTRPRWDVCAIVALGLVVWATLVHELNSLLGPVMVVSDGPIYHLYFAARWWQAGRLFLVASPFGETAAPYFPAVGDLGFAWLMVGWGGDRLAKVGQLPFFIVAGLAAFSAARRLGAGVSAAWIATAWFVTDGPFFLFTSQANVDTISVAGYLLAAYFFLRYALGDERTGALALGALATGGVLGTKPTGIVFGPLLLGAAALAVIVRRKSPRRMLGELVLLALLPLVMVGYWYVQNLRRSGNPLYPLHVQAFGRVWLAGWYGADAMRLSQYYLPVGDWRALGDILLAVLDPRLIAFWAAALAGVWALGRKRTPPDAYVWAFSALALANVAAYWVLIPYRTQQRFMLQAVGLLVVPLARLFERGRWLRVPATVLLAVHLFTPANWPFAPAESEPPWDLTAAVPNSRISALLSFPVLSKLGRGSRPDPDDLSWTLSSLALGAIAFATAWLWGRPGRHGPARALLASVALLALAIPIAYPFRAEPRLLFFPLFPDYFRGWLQLDARAGPSGSRIAYAGTNIPYYLLGVGLRNKVQYVNVDAHRGWLLHDYHREARRRGDPTWPSPWPAWDRLHPDYDAWLANLRAEGIQILVVASRVRPPGSLPDEDRDRFPIERRWAEAHPEAFEPLYGIAEQDSKFRIYRVRPARTGVGAALTAGHAERRQGR
jgi:hypothetical protein